jgi:hypothetical protein
VRLVDVGDVQDLRAPVVGEQQRLHHRERNLALAA